MRKTVVIHGGNTARFWFGLIVLALGVLWTLDSLDIFESDQVMAWWPVILIIYGLTHLLGWGRRAPSVAGGAIWTTIGVLILGHNLRVVPWEIWDFWPVFLIVMGGVIVYRSLQGPLGGRRPAPRDALGGAIPGIEVRGAQSSPGGPPDADYFSAVAVWSGVDRKCTSQSFRGGDYTAIMGGGTVDVRGAKPVPEGAEIEVFVMMGGAEIVVPEDWNVVNRVTAVMGGVEDSRKVTTAAGSHTLVIKGFAMMGGIEIKN